MFFETKKFLLSASMLAGSSAIAMAAPVVSAAVSDAVTVAVSGERSPLLASAHDNGAVDDALVMTHAQVVLKRSAAKQAALDKLVDDQLNRNAPNYHKWLTPADLRSYGPDAADVAKVTAWLQSHGLTVNSVSPSGMMIDVSGPASGLKTAFHANLHNVTLPNGETHIANMTDIAIPAALAPVLRGATLSNFFPKPNARRISPNFTFPFRNLMQYAVTPPDFATIYNLNPLFSGNNLYGARVAGAGVRVAVVEQTLIQGKDFVAFRNVFGLTAAAGKLIFSHPGDCTNPGFTGDEAEAAIDAEYASSSAPDADIVEASCAGGSLGFGVETALQNLVEDGTEAAVLSISYGGPEQEDGLTFLAGWENLVEEGAAEGLSIFVSSGDSGSAAGEEDRTNGLGVNGLSTTPYNTAVGGTDFLDTSLGQNATYWSSKNTATHSSALSYIPETPWNNGCSSSVVYRYLGFGDAITSCNSFSVVKGQEVYPIKGKLAFEQQNIGGTGGQSLIYTKPGWQSAPGVPNDGVRDQPDVSLFAANGTWDHFYVICMSDASEGGSACNYNNVNDILGNAYGGTSVSAPAFAGIEALVVQSYGGARQGNAAPRLYQIATAQFNFPQLASQCNSNLGNKIGRACVFNDVTTGNNASSCIAGSIDCFTDTLSTKGIGTMRASSTYSNSIDAFPTTAGYDLATGLGSVNVTNLLYNY